MDDVEQLFQCFNASSAASLLPVELTFQGRKRNRRVQCRTRSLHHQA
ncbi:hypothetical protein SLEP1_g40812 [Rubroshorea leprosula]|uniref:Uncharacterized protein n=1 Tax=Rubroshorea leprosula TaxID=152421 RepID=A0AAV5L517_9ROSI|nr:hypothetical protein SLEP1_g40812 [Rubroshorea leprosula]